MPFEVLNVTILVYDILNKIIVLERDLVGKLEVTVPGRSGNCWI